MNIPVLTAKAIVESIGEREGHSFFDTFFQRDRELVVIRRFWQSFETDFHFDLLVHKIDG